MRFQDGQGRHVASYDHLGAWDATGRKLPARDERCAGTRLSSRWTIATPGIRSSSTRSSGKKWKMFPGISPLVTKPVSRLRSAGTRPSWVPSTTTSRRAGSSSCVRESPSESEPSYRWKLEPYSSPRGRSTPHQYGFSVATSGYNTAIVGDPLGSFDPNLNPIPSAAYVWSQFRRCVETGEAHRGQRRPIQRQVRRFGRDQRRDGGRRRAG